MDLRGAAARALRDAASEGLTLVRALDNATGFRGVYHDARAKSKPFEATLCHGGKLEYLGRFAAAEEAALAYARALGPEDSKAAASASTPSSPSAASCRSRAPTTSA